MDSTNLVVHVYRTLFRLTSNGTVKEYDTLSFAIVWLMTSEVMTLTLPSSRHSMIGAQLPRNDTLQDSSRVVLSLEVWLVMQTGSDSVVSNTHRISFQRTGVQIKSNHSCHFRHTIPFSVQ